MICKIGLLIAILVGPLAVIAQSAPSEPPSISARITGPAVEVTSSTRPGCDKLDIPDDAPRAFRDREGLTHFVASHYVNRALLGRDLDHLQRNCAPILESAKDPDPSHFRQYTWLDSFWSIDGRNVVALGHSEFHGWELPGKCELRFKRAGHCWWNVITAAFSSDGGYSFVEAEPKADLVASMPYVYDGREDAGAIGYHSPSNILRRNGFYYAFVNDWPYKAQRYGACLIRTANIEDPTSWRGWDGAGFSVRFIDPYVHRDAEASIHVCALLPNSSLYDVSSLVQQKDSGVYVATQFAMDSRFGVPGLYLSTSRDLVHWSKPKLVVSLNDLGEGEDIVWYRYFSLLDPRSADANYTTIGDSARIYYVILKRTSAGMVRQLLWRPLRVALQ